MKPASTWPWWVAAIAAALWLLAAIGLLAALRAPAAVPTSLVIAGAIALLLAAPVAVIILAVMALRETTAARTERADHLAQAAWLADHRLDEAGALLASFEARFAGMAGQMASVTAAATAFDTRLAKGAAALEAAATAANSAGTTLAAIIPVAAAQTGALRTFLETANADLQRQLVATKAMLSALEASVAENTSTSTASAEGAARQIATIGAAAQAAGAAITTASADAHDRSAAGIAAMHAAVTANTAALAANGETLAASVAAATNSLDRIGDAATARAAAHLAALGGAAAQLTGEITLQADRYGVFIEQLERGFAALDARLVASVATGKAELDRLAIGMVAAREAVTGLAPPIDAALTALGSVEARVGELQIATNSATTALGNALPAAQERVVSMTTALAGLAEATGGLAAPIDTGAAAIAAAAAGLERAAISARDRLVAAHRLVGEIETMAGTTTLAASAQLLDVFGRVREVAVQTAGTMRTTLADVVAEAEAALEAAGSDRAETAFAAPVRAALAEITVAQTRAGDAAQAAADRITQRMLALTGTIASVERHLGDAEDAQGARLRRDIAARSATLLASLGDTAIDLAKVMGADIDEVAWAKWLGGERGMFLRRAVRVADAGTARAIARHWQEDAGFRELGTRYLGDFEALIARVMPDRDGQPLAMALLSSDAGKLYVALAQATGRLE